MLWSTNSPALVDKRVWFHGHHRSNEVLSVVPTRTDLYESIQSPTDERQSPCPHES